MSEDISTMSAPTLAKTEQQNSEVATSSGWIYFALLGVITIIAAILRIYNLGTESFSYDEGIMLELTSSSFARVMEDIRFGRPPFLVLLGYLWVNLFGKSEVAVRSLPVLAGILSIPMLYLVGTELFTKRVALIASAIMSVSTFHIFHSQDYRYYSLLTLMTLVSFYFLIRLLRTGNMRYFLPYVITGALVYYTHYQGAFILLAQGLYFLLQFLRYSWRTCGIWVLSQLAILLCLVPSALTMLNDFTAGADDGDYNGTIGAMGNLGPLSDPPLWIPLHTLLIKFMFISIENLLNVQYILAAVALLAICIIGHQLWSKGRSSSTISKKQPVSIWQQAWRDFSEASPNRSWLLLLALWVLVPVFVPLLISKVVAPVYLPRYTIGALPGFCLAIALGLTMVRSIVPEVVTVGALAILLFPGLSNYYPQEYKDQWAETAAIVTQNAQADDKLLFISTNNESATRMQSVFNVYHPDTLSECTLDPGLTPANEISTQFQDCTEGYKRIWIVTRTIETEASTALEMNMLESISESWEIVEQDSFVGTTVRLAVHE